MISYNGSTSLALLCFSFYSSAFHIIELSIKATYIQVMNLYLQIVNYRLVFIVYIQWPHTICISTGGYSS